MFWKKKPKPNPHGVAIGDLLLMLKNTSIKARLESSGLVAQHEHYAVHVEVVPPDCRDSEDVPVQAVVRVKAGLPRPLAAQFSDPKLIAAMNRFAGMGALMIDDRSVCVGSRLTIYESENVWRTLHLPLLMFTTISGSEAILGAMRRIMMQAKPATGRSDWTQSDFEQVQVYLSQVCACTSGGLGFTAEFGLRDGAVSASMGDKETALFQMKADQPHPEFGGGLFCLLRMPHQLDSPAHAQRVCAQLNRMEMAARDLPPHFGAWCCAESENSPAYVSFYPNMLRSAVPGIATNVACWAMRRAAWANRVLESL